MAKISVQNKWYRFSGDSVVIPGASVYDQTETQTNNKTQLLLYVFVLWTQ